MKLPVSWIDRPVRPVIVLRVQHCDERWHCLSGVGLQCVFGHEIVCPLRAAVRENLFTSSPLYPQTPPTVTPTAVVKRFTQPSNWREQADQLSHLGRGSVWHARFDIVIVSAPHVCNKLCSVPEAWNRLGWQAILRTLSWGNANTSGVTPMWLSVFGSAN